MIERNFGQRPAFKDIASSSTDFMKTLLELEVDQILKRARRINKISRTAAQLCGETLQLEGRYDEQKIVWLTHEYVHTLMQPALATHAPEDAARIMLASGSKDTIRVMSAELSSEGFDRASIEYRKEGAHLAVDNGYLAFAGEDALTKDERYAGKGCPYAKGSSTPLHDKVYEKVVDTYAEAYRRDMPKSWIDFAKQSIM
ncbi:MAG TPA: hypothetical protein VGE34_01800 [Candidatus Saccharimonadales bacterium]